MQIEYVSACMNGLGKKACNRISAIYLTASYHFFTSSILPLPAIFLNFVVGLCAPRQPSFCPVFNLFALLLL